MSEVLDSQGTLGRYSLKAALIRNPTWISAGADISLEALNRIEALEAAITAALRQRDEDMRPTLREALHGRDGE